jgi:nitroreductase
MEAIRRRTSWRNFDPSPLSKELRAQIDEILEHTPSGPFATISTFKLVNKSVATDQNIKLGTYGFIKGAQYFIVGTMQSDSAGFVDFGYRMEWIILQLTALDLGTCWLGGSFRRSEFADLIGLQKGAIIPAVTPVGYPAEKRSLRDGLIRLGAGSKRRKPWNEIFFAEDFSGSLTPENAGKYATALEMVRLAPSASNRQPWRVIHKNNLFHFYVQRTPGYRQRHGDIDLQRVDLGIAMCHFELATKELNVEGNWFVDNSQENIAENIEYILSWVAVD